jgi:PAS domain S-box-containing protein
MDPVSAAPSERCAESWSVPGPAGALSAAAARADTYAFAVAVVDVTGCVTAWSPGAERIYGWAARDAIGSPLPTIAPEDWTRTHELLAAAAANAMLSDLRVVWRRRDGTPVEARISLAPLVDAGGAVTAIGIAARDPSSVGVDDAQLEAYARDVRESFEREQRRARALEDSYLATVRALAAAVEAKDGYTGEHIYRVHDVGLLLAEQISPRETGDPQMGYGFLLHDIGKLSVPDAILQKPGKLTDDEFATIRRHPDEGVRILQSVSFLNRALDVVRHHHERWDGGGYPGGLAREEIPLWARIFAIADTLDAMTSDRPYRAAMCLADAFAEIERGAGSQFDPACVVALMRLDRDALGCRLQRAGGGLSSEDGA